LHGLYLTRGCCDPDKWANLSKDYASNSFLWEAAIIYSKQLPHRTRCLPLLIVLLKATASRVDPILGRQGAPRGGCEIRQRP
ncbi:Os11g0460500, partial [Oryza sativa Japonica Group]